MKGIKLLFVIIVLSIISNAQQSINIQSASFSQILKYQINQSAREQATKISFGQKNSSNVIYNTNIDEATARQAAETFMASIAKNQDLKSGGSLELVYRSDAPNTLKSSSSNSKQTTYFYVYNSLKDKGFVIVSGDDRAVPILGYSNTSSFDSANIPPNLKVWLEGYEKEIQYGLENNIEATQETTNQWISLLQGESTNTTEVVAPLIKTRWAQSPYYNDLCPYDNTLGERVAAGCVAVPMAQIMKYWEYPVNGESSHSYTPKSHAEYGVQSADFENTQYNWDAMPNEISAPNAEIAQLMYHCGVSVNMDYGALSDGLSSAVIYKHNLPSTFLAFRKYFGYKSTSRHIYKSSYSTEKWKLLLKNELNENRPVYYGAMHDYDNVGHAFICDGYDNNDYFHFNMGWGGNSDGFYTLDALVCNETNYNNGQEAIIGLEPVTLNPEVDIHVSEKVSLSPSVVVTPGQSLTVNVGFKNEGAVAFNGSFIAVITDSDANPVNILTNSKTFSLPKGANSGSVSFSTESIIASSSNKNAKVAEGTYYIMFMAIDSEGSLKGVLHGIDDHGYYNNFITIIVSENTTMSTDDYENNDSENTAYEITPDFNKDTIEFELNANIHNNVDVDYYKINLSANYKYEIHSLLHDNWEFQVTKEKTYTFDGKYSYKTDDNIWSSPQDIRIDGITYSGNNGYLLFKVEPYFPEYIGSYSLEFYIIQKEKNATSVKQFSKNLTSVYPIPNNGRFTLNLGNDNRGRNEIVIYNVTGKIVYNLLLENPSEISKEISLDVPNGIYLVKVNNNNMTTTKRIIVNK